jgi:hypothetical protein
MLYPRRPCGQQHSENASPPMPPGLEDYNNFKKAVVAPSPSSLPTPFGWKNKEDSNTKLAPKEEDTARSGVVELSGLPKTLMSKAMIETLVDQAAGTKDMRVSDITLAQGKAYVSFANPDHAAVFIDHCHGRPWNPKGPPVSAVLHAPTKGTKKTKTQKKATAKSNNGNKTALPMFSDNMAYAHSAFFKQTQNHAANSETSTAVGDSDGEERLGFPLPVQSLKFGRQGIALQL